LKILLSSGKPCMTFFLFLFFISRIKLDI
jgi:hypothetical protein